jgi:putative membrane protein
MIGASVATLTVGQIFQGGLITYDSVAAILAFGLVLGLANAYVKPVLQAIKWPASCLTFGVLAIVLNILVYGIAAFLMPGIDASLWGVVLGAITTTAVSGVIFAILDEI